MSEDVVGLLAAAALLVLWAWDATAPRRAAKRAARIECQARGHAWGEPFDSAGIAYRQCRRCGLMQRTHLPSSTPRR